MERIPDVMGLKNSADRLLLENGKVRVMEIRLKTGAKSPMHNHPSDHVIYVMDNAKFKLTKQGQMPKDMDLKTGETLWMEAGSHSVENTGNTDIHFLVVEVKK